MVKTAGNKITKCLALLLMTIYLVISLLNLFFLPKYNQHQSSNERAISAPGYSHCAWLYNGVNSLSILFHRYSKTIIENKRNMAIFFRLASTIFLLIMIIGIRCPVLNKEDGNFSQRFFNRRRYSYRDFRSLRI